MAEPETFDVVIVGAGPAGLGAALELRRQGVRRVLVVEREAEPGGVPRHCGHSPFGMRELGRVFAGPAYARRLAARVRDAGAAIRCGATVVSIAEGGGLTVAGSQGVREISARRAILATGVRESSRHARLISGDRPLGVITTGTLQAMIHLRGLIPFARPVIVGTELVALSALLTCRLAGIRPTAMIEEAPGPTARAPLLALPRLLGIPVHYGAALGEIVGQPRVEAIRVARPDGRPHLIPCDGVLLTGRFVPEATLARMAHLEVDPGSGGPAVDQYGRCSDPAWFAAGNLLRPVETAGWSFREGRRIGAAVAADLAGRLRRTQELLPVVRGRGLKLVVPQRLALPLDDPALDSLQIRVPTPAAGELSVQAGGQTVWRRHMRLLPERRILVPLRALVIPSATRQVEVRLVQSSEAALAGS